MTESYLQNAALHYLQRYAASADKVRRVLMRRVERAVRLNGADAANGAALVKRVMAGLEEKGLVDDRVYAEARARSLHGHGASRRGIQARLRRDGIATELVAPALQSLAQDGGDPDLAAGIAFARRRRLGPFRLGADRTERRRQDLASLGRAGFSFDTARTIVDAESEADLLLTTRERLD